MRHMEILRRAVTTALGTLAVAAFCNVAAPMDVEAKTSVTRIEITIDAPVGGEAFPSFYNLKKSCAAYDGGGEVNALSFANGSIDPLDDTVAITGKDYAVEMTFSFAAAYYLLDTNTVTATGNGNPATVEKLNDYLIKVTFNVKAVAPAVTPTSAATASDSNYQHQHSYAWETYKAATATTDGIMRYRCTGCGDVEYEVPTAAYYVFNKETQASIQNAAAGATVTVETPIFISFHEMVKEALIARPDVTLVVDYRNAGKTYEMTIPAGSDDTLSALYGDDQYAGFLYLGGAFATVEK